jgi:hypothetical protein
MRRDARDDLVEPLEHAETPQVLVAVAYQTVIG